MELEPELPTDPQTLRQLVVELLSALQEKERRIGQLSSQLEALRRRIFGRSSEKLDPGQLALDLGAWLAAHPAEAPGAAGAAAAPPQRDRDRAPRHGSRSSPPARTSASA